MNNHCGKGRHLRPINFNKEIFLEFNLGPTYLTEKLVRSVYELRKKEYLYKETSVGGVTHWASQRVDTCGSALKTFRKVNVAIFSTVLSVCVQIITKIIL